MSDDEETPAVESNAHPSKYVIRRDRALVTIILSIDPSLMLYLIGDTDDTADIWKKLRDQFQKKSWANKLAATKEISAHSHVESLFRHNHAGMTEIFNELSIISDKTSDED